MFKKEKGKKEFHFSTTQLIAMGFLGLILLGACLLTLPIATVDRTRTNFLDALFTSCASVCITGLTTVSTTYHWSLFGKIIILILIQLGGLGVVSCVTMILIITNKKITLNERLIIRESYGLDTMEDMVKLIKRIGKGTLLIESIGVIFYSLYFIPKFGFAPGIWRSIFSAISGFCNAGMDILGENSLVDYRGNLIVNFTTMFLVLLGGIGFTVWWDVLHVCKEIKSKRLRRKHLFDRLTLHSKLAIATSVILICAGFIIFFLLEFNNPYTMKDASIKEKILDSLFQSVTTRSSGFYTIPQEKFTNASTVVTMILMFIGGSPAGMAGGIKTTTMAMILLTTVSYVKGRSETEVFKRKIASDNVRLGLVVVTLGLLVVFTAIILLNVTEEASFIDVSFEAVSALATVGLSRNITSSLTTLGKLIIIVEMYIGRIGPITLVLALSNKGKRNVGIDFPEKRIMIG